MRIGCIGTTKMETKINYIWNPKLFEKNTLYYARQ